MLGKDFDRISIQNKETEGFYESVRFYLTSLKNSPGMAFDNWKDGTPLQIITTENSHTFYNIQPEQYKYLKNNGKCQPESFYECIASKLDEIEFKGVDWSTEFFFVLLSIFPNSLLDNEPNYLAGCVIQTRTTNTRLTHPLKDVLKNVCPTYFQTLAL